MNVQSIVSVPFPEMTTSRQRVNSPLGRYDAAWISFWVVAVFGECLRLSWGRQFWSDEIFGWLLAHDPSLGHMFFAWNNGADGGGIVFYLVARGWISVFGAMPVALRMLNATGIAIALALTWIAARTWYRLGLVAFSIPFCWFTAHSVLRQIAIGRFYGLLMAAVAAAVYCSCKTQDHNSPKRLELSAVFVTHTVLVGIHPFGLLYSLAVIAATLSFDLLHRRWRPRIYLAAFAGWWVLLPSHAAMQASAAVGKPHFWTTTPTLSDLSDAVFFWTDEMQWLFLFLLVCLIGRWLWRRHRNIQSSPSSDTPSLFMGFALMAVIPTVWLLSLHGTSYFVDRYLVPTVIGAAFLLCATLDRLVSYEKGPTTKLLMGVAVVAIAGATTWGAMFDMPRFFTIPPHTYTSSLQARIAHAGPDERSTPIVVERVDVFAESVFTQPNLPLFYLLDWDTVLSPASPRGDVSGYHEMQNWQRAGYYANHIQNSDLFLSQQRNFWVISDPTELWFDRHVRNNPAFKIEQVGEFRRELDTETVWHVSRVP